MHAASTIIIFIIFMMQAGPTVAQNFDWLIGQWHYPAGDHLFSEKWEKNSAGMLKGEGYLIKDGDTIFTEKLSIVQLSGISYYIAAPQGQAPVKFILTSDNEDKYIFENPQHDFPQKIEYRRTSDSTVIATVSGVENGVDKSTEYRFTRSRYKR